MKRQGKCLDSFLSIFLFRFTSSLRTLDSTLHENLSLLFEAPMVWYGTSHKLALLEEEAHHAIIPAKNGFQLQQIDKHHHFTLFQLSSIKSI